MVFPFRQSLLEEVKSYANNTPLSTEETIDLSLGVNPYGCSAKVLEAARGLDWAHISDYPHSGELHAAIAAYWSEVAPVSAEEVVLANGSMCALYYLCNLFSGAGRSEVVGFLPTFTDMIEAVRHFGMRYSPVTTHIGEGGRECAEDIIAALTPDTAFVYIDRPQNPFGLTMSLTEVEAVLKAAEKNGSYVIMDEAYGDFIPRAEASIRLRGAYDNLIVTKTFSKGLGLANLRVGYIIAEKEIVRLLNRTLNPYIVSDSTKKLCCAALSDPEHAVAHMEDFASAKRRIREGIGRRIVMMNTDDRVPICTLRRKDGGDLQAELMKYDLLTVSGAEFDALDESCVRLRVPVSGLADRVAEKLIEADKA